jgi:glycosyltransferase involved in cell wall biosynthesis
MIIVENRKSQNAPPFFTIITVVRNGATTLQKCINSIKAQTFQDFEYLIIDGASSDGTIELIRDNSDVISFAVSEEDRGLYFAMNKGLKLARGKYVGILNADDTYFPNTLDLVQEAIRKDLTINVIYGAMSYFSQPDQVHFIHSDELPKRMIFHPTCFVSSDTYKRIGEFDTKYQVAADYEFIMRCFRAGEQFLGLDKVLASFSEGGTSARLRFQSIFETSEIQGRYNFESYAYRFLKLSRILLVTYLRIALGKARGWFEPTMRR